MLGNEQAARTTAKQSQTTKLQLRHGPQHSALATVSEQSSRAASRKMCYSNQVMRSLLFYLMWQFCSPGNTRDEYSIWPAMTMFEIVGIHQE